MSNVYRFSFDSEYDSDAPPFPQAKTVKARYYFEESTTWPAILWEFAKFLEQTGYVGVTDKIIIKDAYGSGDGCEGHFFQLADDKDDK